MNQYKNPMPISNIGDPYVLKDERQYYLYCTGLVHGFCVWCSTDLVNWSEPSVCYTPTDRSFGGSCFWAPEVYRQGDRYLLFYTAQDKTKQEESLRIGLAVADSPIGPFEDLYDRPLFDFGYGALDATVFTDDDGQHYLYYSRAGADHIVDGRKQAEVYAVRLSQDMTKVLGEGVQLLVPSQEWEMSDTQTWNEAPFVLKHQGRYHLMYSANFYASRAYAIGCAWADNPMGPFTKYPDNPILSSSDVISGPGHNCVVASPDDSELFCVYHTHTFPEAPSGDRQVCIDRLFFKDGRVVIDGPSHTDQPMPR